MQTLNNDFTRENAPNGGVAFSETRTPTYIVVETVAVRSRGAFPPEPSRFSHLTIPISGHESLWTFLPTQTHTQLYIYSALPLPMVSLSGFAYDENINRKDTRQFSPSSLTFISLSLSWCNYSNDLRFIRLADVNRMIYQRLTRDVEE